MKNWECPRCTRYRGDLTCDTFPQKIPEAILTGAVSHQQPFGAESEDELFSPAALRKSLDDPLPWDPSQQGTADAEHTMSTVRHVLMVLGFGSQDFEEGGRFWGWSAEQLAEFAVNLLGD